MGNNINYEHIQYLRRVTEDDEDIVTYFVVCMCTTQSDLSFSFQQTASQDCTINMIASNADTDEHG